MAGLRGSDRVAVQCKLHKANGLEGAGQEAVRCKVANKRADRQAASEQTVAARTKSSIA